MNFYERQIALEGFGPEGQSKLQQASVLVVGAGGLGCPAMLYLAAAGIGTLSIIDGDLVSVHNLHRQILFGVQDIGLPKATVAAQRLKKLYPHINLTAYDTYFSAEWVEKIIYTHSVVLDCTDNFETRYLINDACALLQKPLVFGAIYRNESQLAVFNVLKEGYTTHYRDCFAPELLFGHVADCTTAGVMSVVPGILGTQMAGECIKILSNYGEPLVHHLFCYNWFNHSSYKIKLSPNASARAAMPKSWEQLMQSKSKQTLCKKVPEIDWHQVFEKIPSAKWVLVDVREHEEGAANHSLPHLRWPWSTWEIPVHSLENYEYIVVYCASGVRSIKAAERIQNWWPGITVYSVRGGASALSKFKQYK